MSRDTVKIAEAGRSIWSGHAALRLGGIEMTRNSTGLFVRFFA
jgi:hypothetical protein